MIEFAQFLGMSPRGESPQDRDGLIAKYPGEVLRRHDRLKLAASGTSGSRDTTAPRATLVKLSGLKLSFRSSEKASATATLRARGKTIAKGSAKAKSGAISLRLHLTSAGRLMLARGHKLKASLTLTLRDASGNRRALKKTLTVRRP